MMLQALYAGDFRPGEMKLEHPGCARAGREIEQLRAELEQKLPGEDFALVEAADGVSARQALRAGDEVILSSVELSNGNVIIES